MDLRGRRITSSSSKDTEKVNKEHRYSLINLDEPQLKTQNIGRNLSKLEEDNTSLYSQMSFKNQSIKYVTHAILYGGWQPNLKNEPTIRFSKSLSEDALHEDIVLEIFPESSWKSLKRAPASHKGGPNTQKKALKSIKYVLPAKRSDVLQPFENQLLGLSEAPVELLIDRAGPSFKNDFNTAFYVLSNIGSPYVELRIARVENKKIEFTKVSAHHDHDIESVAFDKTGFMPLWTRSTLGLPNHEPIGSLGEDILSITNAGKDAYVDILDSDLYLKRFLVEVQSPNNGYEIVLIDIERSKKTTVLSCLNNQNKWANVEAYSFEVETGEVVWGQRYSPVNQSKSKGTVIYLHGGPTSKTSATWLDIFIRSFVESGYSVLAVNYPGSTGYGRKFQEAGWQNFENVRKVISSISTDEWRKNNTNIFLFGSSYGGYLALSTAVFENSEIKGVVSVNGVTDLISILSNQDKFEGGTSFSLGSKSHVYGDIYDPKNREYLQRNSPISGVDKLSLPSLLIYSKNDKRVSPQQSKSFYRAVLESSEASVLLSEIPGDHDLSEYNDTLKAIELSIEFFENYGSEPD